MRSMKKNPAGNTVNAFDASACCAAAAILLSIRTLNVLLGVLLLLAVLIIRLCLLVRPAKPLDRV